MGSFGKLIIIVVTLISNCVAVTFVNISESATLSLQMPSSTASVFILAPNGAIIALKTNDTCTLLADINKYQLLTTDCSTNLNLKIEEVTLNDAGDYRCPSVECSEKLVVLGPPKKPNITASTERLIEKESITLFCETASTSLPRNHGVLMGYSWFLNGIETPAKGQSLLVVAVQWTDFNNSYTCLGKEVNGPPSMESEQYLLKPEFATDIKMTINDDSTTSQSFSTNDTMHIKCTITAYPVCHNMEMKRDGVNIKKIAKTDEIEIIQDVECYDNAQFQCNCYHPRGSRYSPKINLHIPCPPRFPLTVSEPVILYQPPKPDHQFDLRIIDNPTSTCSLRRTTPNGLLPMAAYSSPGYCKLLFRNWGEDSYGEYQLTAENTEGIFITNITLTGPPARPYNLVSWSTTPNSIHLSWRAGISVGYIPKYQVKYKEEGGSWKVFSNNADSGSKITITITTLTPGTRYYFIVNGNIEGVYGFYSNITDTITIDDGAAPQTEPTYYYSTDVTTNNHQTTQSSVVETTSASQLSISDEPALTFGTGLGIGLGIGVLAVFIAVIVTIACLKKRPYNSDTNDVINNSSKSTGSTMDNNIQVTAVFREATYSPKELTEHMEVVEGGEYVNGLQYKETSMTGGVKPQPIYTELT